MRILVAEDNTINQKVAIGLLEKLGCRAVAVANGLEVLQALELVPYDVIFMDCQLPELDGFKTTMEIRQREAGGYPGRMHALLNAGDAAISSLFRSDSIGTGLYLFV